MLLKTSTPFHCPEHYLGPALPAGKGVILAACSSQQCAFTKPASSEHPPHLGEHSDRATCLRLHSGPGLLLWDLCNTPTISSCSVPGTDKATGEENPPSHLFSYGMPHFQSELDCRQVSSPPYLFLKGKENVASIIKTTTHLHPFFFCFRT